MPIVNVVLSEEAAAFLRKKAPKRTGAGLYLTGLVCREAGKEAMKEEMLDALERHEPALKDAWEEESGLETMD